MSRKRVAFHYDSDAVTGKIKCTFRNNMVFTNDGRTETIGPSLNVLGYAPDSLPLVAAKEVLEEMLAVVNAAMGEEESQGVMI